jgi:outer membrane lipoprotein-sorting protein
MSPFSRRSFLAASVFAPAALAAPSVALADDVGDALDRISAARASLKSLVAPFSQVRSIGLLASEVKSTGELTLVRPDRLRWEIFPPDAVTYWILPDGLYMRSSSSPKAIKAPPNAGKFGAVLGDILAFTGGDLKRLGDRYDLSVPSKDGGITLVAVPKAPELRKIVSRIETRTTADLWGVQKVTIEEASGDKSVVDFGPSVRDGNIDAAKMKPPV